MYLTGSILINSTSKYYFTLISCPRVIKKLHWTGIKNEDLIEDTIHYRFLFIDRPERRGWNRITSGGWIEKLIPSP